MNEYSFNMFKDEGQKRIGNQSNILITNRMSVRYFLVSGKTLIICRQAVCVCVYNTTYIVRTTPLERWWCGGASGSIR
jgi:hypothetical protein